VSKGRFNIYCMGMSPYIPLPIFTQRRGGFYGNPRLCTYSFGAFYRRMALLALSALLCPWPCLMILVLVGTFRSGGSFPSTSNRLLGLFHPRGHQSARSTLDFQLIPFFMKTGFELWPTAHDPPLRGLGLPSFSLSNGKSKSTYAPARLVSTGDSPRFRQI